MPKSVQNILFHSFFVPGAPSAAFRRETLPSWQKPRESSHSCPQTRRGRKIMCKSPLTAEAQIWYTMYHFVGEILKRSTRADCKSAGLRLLRFESLSRHHFKNSVTPGFLFYSKQVSILPRAQSIKFTLEKKASGGFLGKEESGLVVRGGLEPPRKVSKTSMLPLHHRTMVCVAQVQNPASARRAASL